MRRLRLPLLAVVAAIGFAGTASAQTDQDRADGRCFIVLQMFKAAALKQGQLAPDSAVTVDKMAAFYLGRIRGGNPVGRPIGAIITPEIAKAAAMNYLTEGPGCIDRAGQYGIDFKAIVPIIKEATRLLDAEAAKPKGG